MISLRTLSLKSFQIVGLNLIILLVATGCILDVAGLNQAEEELAQIPEVTSVPTKERPSPTPVVENTRADALQIATEVAVNQANATDTPMPTAKPTGPEATPQVIYPLLADGADFRQIDNLLWYNSADSAATIQDFYIDRMTYLRWDNYEIGEAGEGYADIQFEKNFEPVQISVWENAGFDHSSVVIFEVDPMLQLLREIPVTTFDKRWIVIGELSEEEVAEGPPTEYETEYPLPIVRLFYTVRMLDAGWQLIPTERLDTYAMDLQFFKESGERVVIILRDNGVGTTVTLVE